MEQTRERLGSRIGFILLSAGCAIGCGNVWKFPWMVGTSGGGSFVLLYLVCLLLLGLPVMVMEFAVGRAAQASPVRMYHKLVPNKKVWRTHGYLGLIGNVCLMAFYTTVAGWMLYYFYKFVTGTYVGLSFNSMVMNTKVNFVFMAIIVAVTFLILCFKLQGGLEKVTKYLMIILFVIMIVLAVKSCTLEGAKEGLKFYLKPDFSKITSETVVNAMNQSFFTLSLGIGSMAIFGSYIGKERSLVGESIWVIALDTLVAIVAGVIIFPACTTYGIEVDAGPSLLFNTMLKVFTEMNNGRLWGALFFALMVFASLSTVLAVCETILSCFREMTGMSRKKGSLIVGVGIFLISLTTVFGFTHINFHPFGADSSFFDLWDFIVNNNLLPLGSLIIVLFCVSNKGWGWKNLLAEANSGKGLKLPKWVYFEAKYVVTILILGLYILGMISFFS